MDSLILYLNNTYEIYEANNENRSLWNLSFRWQYQKNQNPLTFHIEANNLLNLSNPEVIEIWSDNNIFKRNVLSRLAGYLGLGITLNL